MGVVTSEKHGVFSSNQCVMVRKALYPASGDPTIVQIGNDDPIFVAVDPTGGGGEFIINFYSNVTLQFLKLFCRFQARHGHPRLSRR